MSEPYLKKKYKGYEIKIFVTGKKILLIANKNSNVIGGLEKNSKNIEKDVRELFDKCKKQINLKEE